MLRVIEDKMNCCEKHSQGNGQKMTAVTGWLLPSAFLVLIPKCPLCIMAYTAVATGIGISASTAAAISYLVIAACIGLLTFVLIRTLGRLRPVNLKARPN